LEDERFLKLLSWLDIDVSAKVDLGSLIPKNGIQRVLTWLAYSVTSVLSQSFLVMLFTVFMMVGHRAETDARKNTMGQIENGVRNYVNAKVMVSALTGIVVFLILHFLDVPFAPTFGAFAFLLNFIPNIGSVIATLLPLPVVFFSPGFTSTEIFLIIALPTIVQLSIANILEPKIMGQSLDLHPITILLALIFWGIIWGFLGMVLAVPITAVIKIALENVDFTRPIAESLAGRFQAFSSKPVSTKS
jgi:AI-2 transport protein TqsA